MNRDSGPGVPALRTIIAFNLLSTLATICR
jgi:hypothetical protein